MSYIYGTTDLSLYSFGLSDPTIFESMTINSDPTIFSSMPKKKTNSSRSPPKHRHDGTSPLPLGMDWSPPPRTWDGRNSVWPHDPHTGWSYCVTIPSWIIVPSSRGSDHVVDEKMLMESTKISIIQQNKMLLQELDVTREKLENLQKHQEELELKSKSDVKLLIKEVKALRSSQLELKHEVSRLMNEKLEGERVLHQEKQRSEHANAATMKLLHKCEVLRNRLEECSVNFLIKEEDKLAIDTSSPTDAVDLLTTSDNQIGVVLAEAQLLSQDVENNVPDAGHNNSGGKTRTSEDELRLMLTDMFIDNARLRKQVNSVIRCALRTADNSDEKHDVEEQTSSGKTVPSKFL